MTNLDEHVAALRELAGQGDDGAHTRLRVRRTLERGHAMRHGPRLGVALVVLLVAGVSWGFASGTFHQLFAPEPPAAPVPIAVPAPHITPPPVVMPPPVVAPVEVSPAPAPPRPSPRRVHPRAPDPTSTSSALYARAHELYFHGRDYAAALAAWDAYLAVEPGGQLVVEARYNRALCLVRLDRLAEARDALAPFANGEVVPAGYRQDEARALVERIEHHLATLNGSR
jgi:hypothetical protein